ncbi:VOC family protein [Treponema sp. OMZ 787]|uniref:VOC family protein n=1 Tax=Treponema sp. OMZ 787 TaxID=2563669 RepID=UPI0020A41699|nr:VOC family protein [Treponema sp. OMZ 787]UTC62219.1 VOC family protein [Treponema sp. OMZ 787]
MHHIEIYVGNLKESRRFYTWLLERLGYVLFQDWNEGFSYKKDGFYLVFVQTRAKYIKNKYNRCNIGLNHIAFNCSSKQEVDAIRDELIKMRVTLLYDEKYPHAGGKEHYAVYFEDPDRIKLEVVAME